MQILTAFEQCDNEEREVSSKRGNSLCGHMKEITHMTNLNVNKGASAYQTWGVCYVPQCAWH